MESLPEHLLYLGDPAADAPAEERSKLRQMYSKDKRWEPGQTLKVCFFGGAAPVRKLITDLAVIWSQYANLKFDVGTPGKWRDCLAPSSGFSQIRIGFGAQGLWSVVGRDSETQLNTQQPSMNFGQFDLKYGPGQYTVGNITEKAAIDDKGGILHEFGHAIGLLHEHQNPLLKCRDQIKWTGDGNIYQILAAKPYYWNKEKVDRNLGDVATTDPDYEAVDPDPLSIMMYALDSKLFKSATSSCIVKGSNELSKKDQQIAARIYPAAVIVSGGDDVPVDAAILNRPLLAPASFAAAPVRADYRLRIISDLASEQTSVRRDARIRLGRYLQDAPADELSETIKAMPNNTYRYQLGVAEALARVKNLELPGEDIATINSVRDKTSDATLRRQLDNIKATPK